MKTHLMNAAQHHIPAAANTQTRVVWLLFALILLVGVGLRLAHITTESIWWDEFATVVFLDPPREYEGSPHFERWNEMVIRAPSRTLGEFLVQNRQLDPAAMPLYLAMEYFWNKYVHPSPVALRLLSVLIGTALLPFVFLIARRLFNATAGLVALWCVALSPIHVQFAKEIRMYGLMTLLAAVSVYAFIRLFSGGRRSWWLLYGVATLLLSWTHPFALLLPFVQGLYWLVCHPRDMRRLIIWALVTAVALVPAAAYVATIEFWEQESTVGWMRLPTVVELLNDIFADDAIGATYQVNATPTAWRFFVGEAAARQILSWRWAVGRMLLLGVWAAMGWLFFAVMRKNKDDDARWGDGPCSALCKWSVFLVMWLVVPPLVLYVISVFWRPCIMPRYTVHCSLALYVLVGGAVSLLPRRWLRGVAVLLVCLFYGYQQMLMIGAPQHPDWQGAAAAIREEAHADDLLLAHNWLWRRVFAYNLGPVPNVVSYGSHFDVLAEQCAFFLSLELQSTDVAGASRIAWVVVRTDYFEQGPILALEREFKARGLHYDFEEFGGIQHVLVYRVYGTDTAQPLLNPAYAFEGEGAREFSDLALEFWRTEEHETAIKIARYAIQIDPEYARAWTYKGMSYKELDQKEAAIDALARAVTLDPHDYPWSHMNLAELLVETGRFEEAVRTVSRGLEILPGDPWALTLLGRAYLGLEQCEDALKALHEALARDPHDGRIQQALDQAEAVCIGQRIHD